jgi:hypothetical protein
MATKRYLAHRSDRAGGSAAAVLSDASVAQLIADGWIVRLADKQFVPQAIPDRSAQHCV